MGANAQKLPPLIEWIPTLTPELDGRRTMVPWHLREIGDLFQRALDSLQGKTDEPVRALCSYPIRHFKTVTFAHGVVWLLEHIPELRIMLMTHSNERAEAVAKDVRVFAERSNVGPAKGFNKIKDWRNDAGGGVVVMSADQSREGYDCHVLLVDDPIDEHGAFDSKQREMVDYMIGYYTFRCVRHGRPGPVLIVMSRQHPDDPIGRRLTRTKPKWTYLHKPAIEDLGLPTERAFAENVWSLDKLHEFRESWKEQDPYERLFWSRFQGEPRLEGATYFREPAYYLDLPMWPSFRDAIGVDLSYTNGRASDWFAVVVARFYGSKCYILNATRFKPDPTDVPAVLRGQMAVCVGNPPIYSYASGGDKGVAGRLAADHKILIQSMPPQTNKLWRSTRTIARWNAGDIMLPASAPWVPAFVKRMKEYSGNESSDEDDEVDALVSVCDAMLGLNETRPGTVGPRRI